jgi:hypothetical protein
MKNYWLDKIKEKEESEQKIKDSFQQMLDQLEEDFANTPDWREAWFVGIDWAHDI